MKTNINRNDYIIRAQERKDYGNVENLVRESFWNVYRPGCSEHYVIHVLRTRGLEHKPVQVPLS